MKNKIKYWKIIILFLFGITACMPPVEEEGYMSISKSDLKDKIKGAWAAQTIGVTYGGPTEFRYLKRMIPDSVTIAWSDSMMLDWMTNRPGLYDDIYMDLTFVEVMEKEGIDAPAKSHGKAYAEAVYWLWHANQQGRYNILKGIQPPESGHWLNNPHADDIDFQIEADFAGIMSPGMPNSAAEICDRVGHIMNYGDGYYGGVFVAGLYTQAYVEDNIRTIVENALQLIPSQSTFYRCISDVLKWHAENPDDWKFNWQQIEENWGTDIGCPDGAFRDFNIDAKINSAYVVLGLLYGNGNFGKTMEISTRAGQDSDCNPATSAAILGTILGYNNIPAAWSKGLAFIEDIDFLHTTTSLNRVYEVSFDQALEMIQRNGGEIEDDVIKIKTQVPIPTPFEESFPSYLLDKKTNIEERIVTEEEQSRQWQFEGVGVVLRGKVGNLDFVDDYALESNDQTLEGYVLQVEFTVDDGKSVINELPLDFRKRSHELFFQYELEPGAHELKMQILNPHDKVYIDIWDLYTYVKKGM